MKRRQSVIDTTEKVLHASECFRILYDPPAIESIAGEFVPLDQSSLHPAIIEPLGRHFPEGLFSHQHLAIEHVLAGRHTVTATRTSSGKSLTFALPALHSLCHEADATALFLYPQKAVANDQFHSLKELTASIEPGAARLQQNPDLVARYDGSTDSCDRRRIREAVQLLITNPDMLHNALLGDRPRDQNQGRRLAVHQSGTGPVRDPSLRPPGWASHLRPPRPGT